MSEEFVNPYSDQEFDEFLKIESLHREIEYMRIHLLQFYENQFLQPMIKEMLTEAILGEKNVS